MPPADRSVMVRSYTIGYGVGVPDIYQVLLDTKNQRYYKIEGLEPQNMYIVSVRANNEVGSGPPKYETIRTLKPRLMIPHTPLNPPHGLRAEVLSSNAVVLMWDDYTLPSKAQFVGDGRYYTVRYRSGVCACVSVSV